MTSKGKPFQCRCFLFPVEHKRKDLDEKHTVVDLSHPQGYSVNDSIHKHKYLDVNTELKLPKADLLVQFIAKKGKVVYYLNMI